MSNVILTLLAANWKPCHLDVWTDPDGCQWQLSDNSVSPNIVASAVAKSHLNKDLVKASLHRNGQGMAQGIDTSGTIAPLRTKAVAGNYPLKAAIETIVSAATWPAQRIHDISPSFSALCPRCEEEVESDLHWGWTCRCNADIEADEVQDTQNLIVRATAEATDVPCLWLRGILPSRRSSLKEEHQPPDTELLRFRNNLSHDIVWGSGTYYGDASGGVYTDVPVLRSVGFGVVRLNEDMSLAVAVNTRLPGSIQTVPRGELYALVLLSILAEEYATIDFVTDNLGVSDSFNAGPKHCSSTNNCDLFHVLFRTIYNKALDFRVRWMPSHLLENPKKGVFTGVSLTDLYGNQQADSQAGEASKEASRVIPVEDATAIIFNLRLVVRIQRRLAAILMSMPDRPKVPKAPTIPRVSLARLVDLSSHTIVESESHIRCVRCLSSFKKSDPQAKRWLQASCAVVGSATDKPIPIFYSNVHVGSSIIHHTHKLFTFKGLVYCNKCGCRAGSRVLRGLADRCAPPTQYGMSSLAAIREGQLPPKLPYWPAEPPLTPLVTKRKVDEAERSAHSKLPKKEVIPLGNAYATSLTELSPSLRASSSEHRLTAEDALPAELRIIIDLFTLEGRGEVVTWPPGLDSALAYQTICDFFSPLIIHSDEDTEHTVLDAPVISHSDAELVPPPLGEAVANPAVTIPVTRVLNRMTSDEAVKAFLNT